MRLLTASSWAGSLLLAGSMCLVLSQTVCQAADPKPKEVFTSADDPALPSDFKLQGEYVGDKYGVQVIALGKGALQAVVYPGGLPGAGWDGKGKFLLAGKVEGKSASFKPAEGNRKYLAQNPDEFSAISDFSKALKLKFTAKAENDIFTLIPEGESASKLDHKKTVRQSPSLGQKAPADALVLFDGTGTSAWSGGRLDDTTKLLNTDGKDILTKKKFNNYTMHVEFMLPYRPDARGQGRGNSGFYQVDHYEMQILDSFGLDGKNNECGGIYTKAEPKVNMCLPPLVWQAYDVEFTNAVAGADGKKTKNARLTAKLNGVVIHDNLEITGTTGGSRSEPEGTPGPIKLQGHGNPLQFRNVWIVEKK